MAATTSITRNRKGGTRTPSSADAGPTTEQPSLQPNSEVIAPTNPLIGSIAADTISNVNSVLAFLMTAIQSAEMTEFGRDEETKASPRDGVSLILECCVDALAHSQRHCEI